MLTISIEFQLMEDYTRGTVGTVDEPVVEPNTSSDNMSTLSIEAPVVEDYTRGTVGTVEEPIVEDDSTGTDDPTETD